MVGRSGRASRRWASAQQGWRRAGRTIRITAAIGIVLSGLGAAVPATSRSVGTAPAPAPSPAVAVNWALPAQDISNDSIRAADPAVSVGADGSATAVWVQSNGGSPNVTVVMAATKAAQSATFGTPVAISAAGNNAMKPDVVTARDGRVTAVWVRHDGSNWIVQAASRAAGAAAFGDPVNLSRAGRDSFFPQVASGPDGTTTVVWTSSVGGLSVVQAATRAARASTYSAPVRLSARGRSAESPGVVVGGGGMTIVTWTAYDGDNLRAQVATRSTSAATFSAPVTLSPAGSDAFFPKVAIAKGGAAAVAWSSYDQDSERSRALVAMRGSAESKFGAPQTVSGNQDAVEVGLAMNSRGSTGVVWSNASNASIQGVLNRGGGFTAPSRLSEPGVVASAPQISVAPSDAVTATWWVIDGQDTRIQSLSVGPGVDVQRATLSESDVITGPPALAQARDGSPMAVWLARTDGTPPGTPVVQVASVNPSITIRGVRSASDSRLVKVSGSALRLSGKKVSPWVKLAGEDSYSRGKQSVTVRNDGTFEWQRKAGRAVHVYFAHGDVRSSSIRIGMRDAQQRAAGALDLPDSSAAAPARDRRGGVPRTTMHTNQLCIAVQSAGSTTASFTWSGQYNITGGQPWGGVTSAWADSDICLWTDELGLVAQAGRKGSAGPAQWFMSNASRMIGADLWFATSPSALNFAFTGTLTVTCSSDCGAGPVGTFSWPVVVGQGSTGSANNWWIGGENWQEYVCPALPGSNADECMESPSGDWVLIASASSADTFSLMPQ